jgi:protein tyrosine/serine phosphatase
LALTALFLAAAAGWGQPLLTGNLRTVVPGKVYRSAQLSPDALRSLIREQGIRTVINLRGGSTAASWFREQAAVCEQEGVEMETVHLSASLLPRPAEISALIHDFDTARYPVLIHCRSGADRTGLAAALYLYAYEGQPLGQALDDGLTWRYGHIPITSGAMDRFFALYRRTSGGTPMPEWIHRTYPSVYASTRPDAERTVPGGTATRLQ